MPASKATIPNLPWNRQRPRPRPGTPIRALLISNGERCLADPGKSPAAPAQVSEPGQFVTGEIAGEPLLIVRGADRGLRGFFNVCRHRAAAVVTGAEGHAEQLSCPYHGWTYSLSGELLHAPQFAGVKDFACAAHGLVPIEVGEFNGWLCARLSPGELALGDFLGSALTDRLGNLGVEKLHWLERRSYLLRCNWKVFVDNYLDGGYHVPHLHAGLNSVLAPGQYAIETGARYCCKRV